MARSLVALLALFPAACGIIVRPPAATDAAARAYLALLKAGQLDSAAQLHVPALQTDTVRATLGQLAALLAPADLGHATYVGYEMFRPFDRAQPTRFNVRYQAETPSGPILAVVAILDSAGTLQVAGLRVHPIPPAVVQAARFSLSHKRPGHYLVLALMAVSALTCLIAAGIMLRTPLRRRWLWAALCLIAVVRLTLNWTTGQFRLRILAVQLFGAGAHHAPLEPWFVSAALPLGAVIALLYRRRWVRRGHGGEAPLGGTTSGAA